MQKNKVHKNQPGKPHDRNCEKQPENEKNRLGIKYQET